MGQVPVLIVYKDETKRLAIKKYLSRKGYNIYTAESYAGAVKTIKTTNIELVITDSGWADRTVSRKYQSIKIMNPMILIIRIQLKDHHLINDELVLSQVKSNYIKKMLNILEVQENVRYFYSFKAS